MDHPPTRPSRSADAPSGPCPHAVSAPRAGVNADAKRDDRSGCNTLRSSIENLTETYDALMPYRHAVPASSVAAWPAVDFCHLAKDLVVQRERRRWPVALGSLAFDRTRLLPLQMLPGLAWPHA